MPAIGLTGGIGSGKSTVAAILGRLGAAVVDTDEISRALTAPGGAALPAIREAFGPAVFDGDGLLDRAALRSKVFGDAAARGRLEAILHPAIRAASDEALARSTAPYALLVVPLLFESGAYRARVARVVVVDCPEPVQVERTMRRSALPEAEVRRIMDAQWPRWRRLQMADDVVWNGAGADAAALEAQCGRLHGRYCGIGRGIAPQSRATQGGGL